MYIGKVIGKVVSVVKHKAYENRTLLIVEQLDTECNPTGKSTIAVDYVGAGEGDIVIVGAGPGTADEVFGLKYAPMRELIQGIIEQVELCEPEKRLTLSS